jgi:hypothetical protein
MSKSENKVDNKVDLAARFKEIMQSKKETVKELVQYQTSSEMQNLNLTVNFGKHKDSLMATVWQEDQSYIAWCLAHIKQPSKDQRPFLRFVELKIQEAEAHLLPAKATKGQGSSSKVEQVKKQTDCWEDLGENHPHMARPVGEEEEMLQQGMKQEVQEILVNMKEEQEQKEQLVSHRLGQIEAVLEMIVNKLQEL